MNVWHKPPTPPSPSLSPLRCAHVLRRSIRAMTMTPIALLLLSLFGEIAHPANAHTLTLGSFLPAWPCSARLDHVTHTPVWPALADLTWSPGHRTAPLLPPSTLLQQLHRSHLPQWCATACRRTMPPVRVCGAPLDDFHACDLIAPPPPPSQPFALPTPTHVLKLA